MSDWLDELDRLIKLRFRVECRIGSAGTVAEVWRLNDQLEQIDATIDAKGGAPWPTS